MKMTETTEKLDMENIKKKIYQCENCKYHTELLCNFKAHLESQKHIVNIEKNKLT